uniref:Ig-like domain-containing protein n=1 Tax=Acrobeloides nanus TaxID=290746 RepID=A0A914CYE5_9BILA
MLTKAYICLIFLVITVHAVSIIDEIVGRNATKGESFTFSCTFHGNGPLVYARWVRNGIVYKENLFGSKEQTLNLTFNDVQPEDKGSYDCEVMDADGRDSRSVQLNVFSNFQLHLKMVILSKEDLSEIRTLLDLGWTPMRIYEHRVANTLRGARDWKLQTIYDACRKIRAQGGSIERKQGSGRPRTIRTEENMRRVEALLKSPPRIP